jgi:hypothetical protein
MAPTSHVMPISTDSIRYTVSLEPDLHHALRQARREDQEDLAAINSRAKERTLRYRDFLARLGAQGTL